MPGLLPYDLLCDFVTVEFAVTLSSTGAKNRFKEMTPATSGVMAQVSLAIPYPEPFRVTGPLPSLVLRTEDMCYERRRAEVCVDESAHHALVNAGGREIV